jgi:hypothetical protein
MLCCAVPSCSILHGIEVSKALLHHWQQQQQPMPNAAQQLPGQQQQQQQQQRVASGVQLDDWVKQGQEQGQGVIKSAHILAYAFASSTDGSSSSGSSGASSRVGSGASSRSGSITIIGSSILDDAAPPPDTLPTPPAAAAAAAGGDVLAAANAGGYVCVLDDDVLLHPLGLMQLVDELEDDPGLFMATGVSRVGILK